MSLIIIQNVSHYIEYLMYSFLQLKEHFYYIFEDLRKAFHLVDTIILLHKLAIYNYDKCIHILV